MGLCLSTASQSSERTGQGRILRGMSQPERPHVVSIHVLDDDSLLNIFHLYRPFFLGEDGTDLDPLTIGLDEWHRGNWWYQLAHVCGRWRNIILGSASYLRLSLLCTNGTPVQNMLADSPPIPLTVDYRGGSITAEDKEGILLALEQRHRVRHLRLYVPVQNLQKLVMAIDGEFPILEYLIVDHWEEDNKAPLMLPETLQVPHLRHLVLKGFTCPIRPRLHPAATSIVTLSLIMNYQSTYFQPNILLQWISFMPQLETLNTAFTFPVPNREVERQLTHTPITTLITLPNLRSFCFRGVSAYLEAVLCRITTPRLEKLQIRFFKQLTFSVPRLSHFMSTTGNLRFDSAKIIFYGRFVCVEMKFRGTDTYYFHVDVDCWHLDWQVSSTAQISNALIQIFSTVEHLTLGHHVHSQSSEEHNDVDRIVWQNLVRPFNHVKTLEVEDGLVEGLSHCLRSEDGELPLELLPELQKLTYSGSRNAGDAFTAFIDARRIAGRPVTLVRPSPSPSSASLEPPEITSPSEEAGNATETRAPSPTREPRSYSPIS